MNFANTVQHAMSLLFTAAEHPPTTTTTAPQPSSSSTRREEIYVLLLEQSRFYVGKSSDVEMRFAEHCGGVGCEWTRLYPALLVFERRPVTSLFDEDNVTKEYMRRCGIDRVRGGSYSQPILLEWQLSALKAEFATATDCCYRCGSSGHYAAQCSVGASRTASSSSRSNARPVQCTRCGRAGHFQSNCYAARHINGTRLSFE
jgi:predicted GIY-YIG superfamily endonuclease